MTQTVVLTGAAGNLGQKLSAYLVEHGGYEIRRLDVRPGEGQDIEVCDLAAVDDWMERFSGADVVVHLAGNASSDASWHSLIEPNIDAVLNVYQAAAKSGVRKVVLASSVWTMAGRRNGIDRFHPREADPGGNAYGATKLFAERVGLSFWRSHGLSTVALRLGGCRAGANPPLRLNDPWEDQCWISNRDACEGFRLAIEHDGPGVVVANLTSRNFGSRWSLEETTAALGYAPRDGLAAPAPAPAPAPARKGLWKAIREKLQGDRPGAD